MFEDLSAYPKVVARHHDGSEASKRLRYLKHLAEQRADRETLLARPQAAGHCGAAEPVRRQARWAEIDAAAHSWARYQHARPSHRKRSIRRATTFAVTPRSAPQWRLQQRERNLLSTQRRQTGILVDVHSALRESLKLRQPQLFPARAEWDNLLKAHSYSTAAENGGSHFQGEFGGPDSCQ